MTEVAQEQGLATMRTKIVRRLWIDMRSTGGGPVSGVLGKVVKRGAESQLKLLKSLESL